MPLLNICGITRNNQVIQLGLCFLASETEVDYSWVIEKFKNYIAKHMIEEPNTLITDRELALMNAINTAFPNSIHILCRWHVNINVLAKTKKHFPSPVQDPVTKIYSRHPKFKDFMKMWNRILRSTSRQDYESNLAEFEAKNPSPAVKYCVDTWLTLWKEKLVSFWVN
jgi:hypothetical protein